MTVLGDVFDSLKAMSLLQLLLAFFACTGYAIAQGRLFGARGRRRAWVLAAVGAAGFAFESAEWTYATMLLGFAVAGLGLFVAAVWFASWALGFARTRMPPPVDTLVDESFAVPPPTGARARASRSSEHAHSI